MGSVFLKQGNTYVVSSTEAMSMHERLPAGNYVLKLSTTGFLLEHVEDFYHLGKVYGDTEKRAGRVIETFLDRPSSTGLLLAGEKGSGKTLIARRISERAANLDIPTIIINTPFCGDAFNSFIQSIEQEAIILFDEFEKVYDAERQELVLTLLDGVFPSKKLFIITTNDTYKINTNMKNRPGRIYYMFEYKGVSEEFVTEYCEDNLKDKSHISRIVAISNMFYSFNFDMLKALVEEMNRYEESPDQALDYLNTKPEFKDNYTYAVELHFKGQKYGQDSIANESLWRGNPIMASHIKIYYKNGTKDSDGDDNLDEMIFLARDLQSFTRDTFTFKREEDGATLIMRRQKEQSFDWRSF